MARRCLSGIGNYSKIPLHDHYIQLLVKEGMEEGQAKELISVLDNQVCQQYHQVIFKNVSSYPFGAESSKSR